MTGKPVRPRALAHRDVQDAIRYYSRQAGDDTALRFVDALEMTYRSIAKRPAAGSLHYAHALQLPGLRSRGLRRFPYLVFYVDRADCIDVWRVLHTRRDIPARLIGS